MEIQVQVPTARGLKLAAPYIIGRNGYYEITALQFKERYQGVVDVQAIGKRDKTINGGFFVIRAEDIDALCIQWIQARGGLAILPGDEGVTALVTMCSGVPDEVILSTDAPALPRRGERYVGCQDPDKYQYHLECVELTAGESLRFEPVSGTAPDLAPCPGEVTGTLKGRARPVLQLIDKAPPDSEACDLYRVVRTPCSPDEKAR